MKIKIELGINLTLQPSYKFFHIFPALCFIMDTQRTDYIVHGVGGETEYVIMLDWLVWSAHLTLFVKNKNAKVL